MANSYQMTLKTSGPLTLCLTGLFYLLSGLGLPALTLCLFMLFALAAGLTLTLLIGRYTNKTGPNYRTLITAKSFTAPLNFAIMMATATLLLTLGHLWLSPWMLYSSFLILTLLLSKSKAGAWIAVSTSLILLCGSDLLPLLPGFTLLTTTLILSNAAIIIGSINYSLWQPKSHSQKSTFTTREHLLFLSLSVIMLFSIILGANLLSVPLPLLFPSLGIVANMLLYVINISVLGYFYFSDRLCWLGLSPNHDLSCFSGILALMLPVFALSYCLPLFGLMPSLLMMLTSQMSLVCLLNTLHDPQKRRPQNISTAQRWTIALHHNKFDYIRRSRYHQAEHWVLNFGIALMLLAVIICILGIILITLGLIMLTFCLVCIVSVSLVILLPLLYPIYHYIKQAPQLKRLRLQDFLAFTAALLLFAPPLLALSPLIGLATLCLKLYFNRTPWRELVIMASKKLAMLLGSVLIILPLLLPTLIIAFTSFIIGCLLGIATLPLNALFEPSNALLVLTEEIGLANKIPQIKNYTATATQLIHNRQDIINEISEHSQTTRQLEALQTNFCQHDSN